MMYKTFKFITVTVTLAALLLFASNAALAAPHGDSILPEAPQPSSNGIDDGSEGPLPVIRQLSHTN